MARQGRTQVDQKLSDMRITSTSRKNQGIKKTLSSAMYDDHGALPKRVDSVESHPKKSHIRLPPLKYPPAGSCPCDPPVPPLPTPDERNRLRDDQREKAYQECTKRAQAFRDLGAAALCKGKYEEALSYFAKGIEHTKDKPELFTNRGASSASAENFRRATADCNVILYEVKQKHLPSAMQRIRNCKPPGRLPNKP